MSVNNLPFSENCENKSKDSNVQKKEEEKTKPVKYKSVPPDGGWGWLVVFGTVVINLLISGFMKSFGMLFVELLAEFQTSAFIASYIPALSYFLHCSLGPLASYLTTKYSYRSVTLVGAILTAAGMILSVFATSIVHLYLTYGILVGVGGSLTLPIGIYIVNSYFVHRKGLASGIAVSGGVIGSIIMPTLLSYLLEMYKVRGTMLIMGGIMLNTIFGALLYHPVKWHMKKVPTKTGELNDPALAEIEKNHGEKCDGNTNKEKEELAVPSSPPPYYSINGNNDKLTSVEKNTNSKFDAAKSNSKKKYRLRYFGKWSKGISNVVNLLQEPLFVLLLLSNVIASISYANLLILLPTYAVGRNFDKLKASYLLSIVAVFDFIGRISGSTISDLLPYNKTYYYVIGLMISGLSLTMFPLAKTYFSLCIFSGIFGLSTGTHIGAILVTLIEILGEDRLKLSLSVIFFVKGIVHLVGMPICGFIYECVRSYVVIISGLGSMLIIISVLWIIVARLNKPKSEKKIALFNK